MTIYYNPAYSAAPYRNGATAVEFGDAYCGDVQLLQKLLFYACVPYAPASKEVRMAHYYAHMQQKIDAASPFYSSFNVDSAGMTSAILAWRDALVEVGWNVKAYAGESKKLALLRDVEPEAMPRGEADYWYLLLQIASERKILPEGVDIVVTADEKEFREHIAHILSEQSAKGVKVEYRPIVAPVADGNLGKIQAAFLSGSKDKIVFDGSDDTFCYTQFANEDEALRYVATEPVDSSSVYYCSKPKRFDNTLKLLGKPAIGSTLTASTPQVVQLFMLGNGLFEYPLNVHRIIEWLNTPINPIRGDFRRKLSSAIVNSGGVNNEAWNKVKSDFLGKIEDDKERKECVKNYDKFLPLPQGEKIDVAAVIEFNENLRQWVLTKLQSQHTDEVVKEQYASVYAYCSSLIKMLESAPSDFSLLDLQLWCRNIAQPSNYSHYKAEVASHNTIASMGDIHDVAERVVWFPAEDSGVANYPFEMLNENEYTEVAESGAKIYERYRHSFISQSAVVRMLLNTKRITIIEAKKSNGENILRHPLVLQLNERIQGGIKSVAMSCEIAPDALTKDAQVCNKSANSRVVELDDSIELKERHIRKKDSEKESDRAESYSSLNQLIQHPFEYVCEKCASLNDHILPSAQDLNKTLGNVAHLIVEEVFGKRPLKEVDDYYKNEYDAIFERAVNEVGLLLRLPEYSFELRRLKSSMRVALNLLSGFITVNGLTVDGCEHDFKLAKWAAAGEGVMLNSRADMLLSDRNGGKVILDFKYTSKQTGRRTEIEQNRALQLEVYRFMAKQEFGENIPVRVAFVLLPDVIILTADEFDADTYPIECADERKDKCVMTEAAFAYKFRWQQLKEGKIERVEGAKVGTGDYGEQQDEKGLFPLSSYSGKEYDKNRFDKGHKNLK